MLVIKEYEDKTYPINRLQRTPADFDNKWISFTWSTGSLTITKHHWDKMSRKKRNIILSCQ